ncbi:low temperature requirement protein LtrA [Streptomyces sp. 1114.5]|uniref:low temperature requirement protein A n=1 Tax=unclassified Streptomyces TaxID=2593676 RepID=UPI000BC4B23C|nr:MULTISPECIES: low temperature requirement protein A [unclassified Streptomyces]RKT17800.1 low temperature requirement protein LtrA [Streptomyces sp. 1114.5]SOB84007.1 Low temperature requirement protein LtrA [Streptomyces sp. 1331.2]
MASDPAAAAPRTRHVDPPPVRRMVPRDRHEPHRVATPLELFFDLCFVVAVGQAGRELAHSLAAGHYGEGLRGYVLAFFAIWWAWMNFTWFASAYDCDDVPYRVTTLVQIAGVLILAAGVPRLFATQDMALSITGYVVMRLAMVTQWLRAAAGEQGEARRVALRYALGIALCQVGWVVVLFLPHGARPYVLPIGVLCELAVPVIAELRTQTSWHPHHIAERYGLFTLIVLGETVAAATVAVQSAVDEHEELGRLVPVAIGGLLICFAAWWIYFARPVHEHLRSNRQAFAWGYGHYLVFGSAAAIGAGLEVAVESTVHKAEISERAATATVTVPTALYLVTVWFLHSRHTKRGAVAQALAPAGAVLVLACTALGGPGVLAAGLVCALMVAAGVLVHSRESRTSV